MPHAGGPQDGNANASDGRKKWRMRYILKAERYGNFYVSLQDGFLRGQVLAGENMMVVVCCCDGSRALFKHLVTNQ